MQKNYAYVVTRDYGFAPNPFWGVMSLATCKPCIRNLSRVGDRIFGFTSKQRKNLLIYAMKVTQIMSYDNYWADPIFIKKRPMMNGSMAKLYGDNIYHHDDNGNWVQENSHHSYENGIPNMLNLHRDTRSDKVLLSTAFYYFGSEAIDVSNIIDIPNLKLGRGHRIILNSLADSLWAFLSAQYQNNNFIADPLLFAKFERYNGK